MVSVRKKRDNIVVLTEQNNVSDSQIKRALHWIPNKIYILKHSWKWYNSYKKNWEVLFVESSII